MKIRFPERGRSGRDVVTIKNLDFSYEDKVTNNKSYWMYFFISDLC